MAKSSKKKATKPKGNSPPRAGVVPHDFGGVKKDNPPFRIQMIFSKRIALNMIMPFQSVPGKVFQCGIDNDALHHAAKEGIRSLLVASLRPLMEVDESAMELLEAHVESCYHESATGSDVFHYSRPVGRGQTTFHVSSRDQPFGQRTDSHER